MDQDQAALAELLQIAELTYISLKCITRETALEFYTKMLGQVSWCSIRAGRQGTGTHINHPQNSAVGTRASDLGMGRSLLCLARVVRTSGRTIKGELSFP